MSACVIAETAAARLLMAVAPVHALGVVYLGGVLLESWLWGLGFGLATALVSAVAFDLFLTAPAWSLRPFSGGFIAITALLVSLAVLGRWLSVLRHALADANARLRGADLSAQLAQIVLECPDVGTATSSAARCVATTFGLRSASIEPGVVPGDDHRVAFRLHGDGSLVVPAGLPRATLDRLREEAVPPLELVFQAARMRERAEEALHAGRDQLQRIADEQTALRHLAMLVARNVPPAKVFDAVAREMGEVLGAKHTLINRYEADGQAVTTVGAWNYETIVSPGSRWEITRGTVSDLVFRTHRPGRVDAYDGTDTLATRLREHGVDSSVGCPIIVGRHLWGVAIASSVMDAPLPADTEVRMLDFVELAATAIANAQSHADLIASRARVVTATDEARRRVERDLHDGTQQRLVSILLDIRALESTLPAVPGSVHAHLEAIASALQAALAELQEVSRGLHPTILTRSGLRQALSAMARRSGIPVELDVAADRPLPQAVEVTVYYVVSEALANAVKHAHAPEARVRLTANDEMIRVTVEDDGVGDADPSRGSGLSGLADRVAAMGGRLTITSPPGAGTTLVAEIPTVPPHLAS
jgi:signal transduction histidine kinase